MIEMIRLAWKEYRALRGLWLALALFGLACDAMICFFVNGPLERLPGMYGFAGVLPAGFALGAGAMLFALEREDATYEFLRCLPVTSLRVFASKILTALVGTLLLALFLFAVTLGDVRAIIMRVHPVVDRGFVSSNLIVAALYGLIVVQGMGWSVLFSLRSARTLLAALLGALGALSSVGLVHFATGGSRFDNLRGILNGPVLHLVATLAVWSVNFWLGSRWLQTRRVRQPRRNEAERALKRLLWQEWRSSYRLLAAIALFGVLVPMALWPVFIPTTVLGFALLGSCTFLADQEGRQFRFFAERGISPRRLWLSRQLFWGGATLGLAAIVFVVERLWAAVVRAAPNEAQQTLKSTGWIFEPHNYVIWVVLAFAAGQVCSMFFQSGVLAATFGVVVAGLFVGWMTVMHALDIGLWWSAAPLAIALFAATWLRSTGWLLERHTWRAWAPALLVLAITIATLLAAVPVYRVWEIPEPVTSVEIGPPPRPSAEAALAASRVERLCESASNPTNDMRRSNYELLNQLDQPASSTPSADEIEWLKTNEDTLIQAMAAIQSLPRDATIASGSPRPSLHLGLDGLGAMILRFGQLAEDDGNLDEAWRRYQAVFRLAAFVRRENGAVGEIMGDSFVTAAARQLIRWGARKGQTVEKLGIAIDELRRSEADDPPLAEVVLQDYRDYAEIVDNLAARSPDSDDPEATIAKWAPWELARLRRLYRYTASLNLLDARSADAVLAGRFSAASASSKQGDAAPASQLWKTAIIGPPIDALTLASARYSAVCHRRAAQLVVAAEAWRLEHGELPPALDDFAKTYLDSIPFDPYTRQAFKWYPWGLTATVRCSHPAEMLVAGTPFVYSPASDSASQRTAIERFRRRSADESVKPSPIAEESMERFDGLVFPIPGGRE